MDKVTSDPNRNPKKNYISVREAFELFGQFRFGDAWTKEMIENSENELHQKTLDYLIEVFQSGEVDCFYEREDRPRPIHPREAASDFFKIDIASNSINLAFYLGEPISCRINASELLEYFSRHFSSPQKHTANMETKCFRRIVEFLNQPGPDLTKAELHNKILLEFPSFPKAAFDRARNRAIEKTGKQYLKKAGRPLRSH